MSVFAYAGVSRLNGEFKVRFANDQMRVKVLAKNGHKDIDIIQLKEPMSKEDAVAFLVKIDFATRDGVTNVEVQAALADEMSKRTEQPKVEKAPKVPKAEKAPKVVKPTLETIRAKGVPKSTVTKAEVVKQLADLEDAPF